MKLVSIHKQWLLLMMALQTTMAVGQTWSLQQCIDTATIKNPMIEMGSNRVAMSAERYREARSMLLPKVSAAADYRYYTDQPYQLMPQSVFGGPEGVFKEAQFGVPHNINATLQAQMPLYQPQLHGAMTSASVAGELQEEQLRKTRQEVTAEVTELYYNLQVLKRRAGYLMGNIENNNRLLNNMKRLHEHLLVKGSDVDKVRLQSERLVTQLELVNSRMDQTTEALKFVMGVDASTHFSISDSIILNEPSLYSINDAPDIRIAEKQKQLLNTELTNLRNSRLPALSLYGAYGTMGYGYDGKPETFLNFYPLGYAGIQLTAPLFSGTVTHRKIKQKKLEILNGDLQVEMLRDKNRMETDNALKQRDIAYRSVRDEESQLALAQKIYDQTILQHREGTASLTDVLLADNTLRETQLSLMSSIIEYLKADLELKKITGNL